MSQTSLPVEVQKFIARHIRSLEQLEILCLLVGNPARAWSEAEVFKQIQSSPESVGRTMRRFTAEGLFVHEGGSSYRFEPKSPEMARPATELAALYKQHRVAIIEAIYRSPLDPVRQFADAFRIRKDKT